MGELGGRSMHDFAVKLQASRGYREQTDIELLQDLIPGCVSVVKTDEQTDRQGVDYIATLRRGAEILIDAKSRERGASRYWNGSGPELALEIWSVRPGGKYNTPWEQRKVGWSLCEAKQTDMIYYTFDPSDCGDVFLLPFQHLRMAFRQNWRQWSMTYRRKVQDSYTWESVCVFIPANVVIKAIESIERCHVTREMRFI